MENIATTLESLKACFHQCEEPKEDGNGGCPKCDGSGLIKINRNGQIVIRYCSVCEQKQANRRYLKQSGISKSDYEKYSFKTFKIETEETKKMKDIAYGFIEDKTAKGMGVFGKSGTGKTHICIATCQEMNMSHLYWQYRTEIQRLKNSMYKDYGRYDELISKAKNAKCLYIDDLFKGAMKKELNGNVSIQEQDLQIMFDIINNRYIKSGIKTIVSSEFTLNEIFKADEAIGGRIYEMVNKYALKLDGKNRRLTL